MLEKYSIYKCLPHEKIIITSLKTYVFILVVSKLFYLSIILFSVKYLGLLAMSRILKSHPKSVQAHKDLVLACLDDKDESIRLRALGLLYGMVRIHLIP